jgi:hypothetical protein
MGVTRLKRKDRKNKARANNRVARIKQLLSTPVIKNVDIEELKAGFKKGGTSEKAEKKAAAKAPAASKASAPEVPSVKDTTVVPAGTPSAEEVFEATERTEAQVAAQEADALEPGVVETPGEQFVRNQLADTTSNVQDSDIAAIQKVEDDENKTEPTA